MDVTARKKKGLNLRLFEGKIGRAILIASFIILTVGLPLAYLFTKNQTPVASWFNNSWEYRQAITVGNSGSLKTNYDVLLEVDTASLVASGKIQNDCDDIRFVDSDDTTSLNYWIESGCNTSATQIWFRIPSLPNGGKTAYMYYGNGSAASAGTSWSGNSLIWFTASCPTGWTRVTTADGKFLMGSASYGQTGGASTHSHSTISCTSGIASDFLFATSGGVSQSTLTSATHSNLQQTVESTSNIPSYVEMVLCQKNSTTLPQGAVASFDSSAPSGWTRISSLDGKFPFSETSYGGNGGGSSHTHNLTGNAITSMSPGTNVVSALPTGGTITTSGNYRIHTFTSSGTFSAPTARDVEVLVVGGGGGGGGGYSSSARGGGGGGGGQVVTNSSYSANGAITVTVGGGGAGGLCGGSGDGCPYATGTSGSNGGNSVFGTITALGGGGGGHGAAAAGLTGGNGGGGGTYFGAGGTATAGNPGAQGSDCNTPCRAGGGGASGGAGISGLSGGGGGNGIYSTISGVGTYYGGGGGGGQHWPAGTGPGPGGLGGGAKGGPINSGIASATLGYAGFAASANTGGGGGGGIYRGYGGNGGSGIVIVRYPLNGTGGTITTSGGYMIHTFTSSGTFTPPIPMSVEVLVVGGGGGGGGGEGSATGGGGGGGGVVYHSAKSVSGAVSVVVGSGGAGGATSRSIGSQGSSSSFSDIVALGGAGGAGDAGSPTSGGSGGGGTGTGLYVYPSSGTQGNSGGGTGYGFEGARGDQAGIAGGGGGAGGDPGLVTANGGPGFSSSISGSSLFYGGGGGGGALSGSAGTGGSGVGGDGGLGNSGNATNGMANRGGGGGGARLGTRGSGGSGVVIVRYPDQNALGGSPFAGVHTHTSSNGTSGSGSNMPAYVDLVFASKDTQGESPTNSILMFNSLPPMGWSRYTSLDNKFARGSATPGGTGGGDTHTHSVTISVGMPSSTVSVTASGGTSFASSTHNHSCTTDSPPASSVPPYFSVIYGQKIDNTANGVTYSFSAEESNVPLPPTITAAQGLSTTSIRWNFIDNAVNETGFKVYDMAGNLKVTCVGTNLSYCDEEGLSVNTQYERQVKAYNDNGDSLTYSSSTTRYTLAPVPTANVTGVTVDSATVEVGTMTNYNVDQSGWYFDCLQTNCDNGSFNTWVTSTSLVDTGLNGNTQYTFRVKARNGDGVETAYSISDSQYTLAPVPDISFSANTYDSITLGVSNVVGFGTDQSAALFECTSVSAPECSTGGTWQSTGSQTISGLDANKEYSFRVKVRNGDGIETDYSSVGSSSTLSRPPLALSLSNTTSSTVKVTLNADANGNPPSTEYLVRHVGTGKYLNALTGLLQVTAYWGTYNDFGSTSGVVVTGLEEGVLQAFDVKSRNSEAVESDYSSSSQVYTLLIAPTLTSGQAQSSSVIRWNFTDNTGNETGFKVYDGSNNLMATCVGSDLGHCDETSLAPNTSNTRTVVAFNSNVESAKSNEESVYTRTNTPDAPTVSFGSTQAQITINANSNPVTTLYSIYEQSGLYLQSDGSLGASEVKKTTSDWGTITVTGLSANTSYSFAVKAENGDATHQTTSQYTTGSTLAEGLSAPTVTGSSTTNVDVEIDPSGNPSTTQYAIYHVGSDMYVDLGSVGATVGLVEAPVWGTFSQWGGTSGKNVTGFTPNTLQEFKVKARNGDGVEGSLSPSGSGYTFANVTSAPSISAISSTVLKVVVNQTSNPVNTEFAVQINNNLYINNQTGVSQSTPDFAVYSEWGGAEGVGVTGLSPNGSYSFKVYARNGDGFITSSSASSSLHTLANVPGIPELNRISSTSAQLILDNNGNPSTVSYAIQEVVSGDYVALNGNFTQSAVWGTATQWGSSDGVTLNQLAVDTQYEFRVKARNSDNVETAYSSTTNSYSSLGAPTIGTATVLDGTTIRWGFSENLSNELGFRILNSNGDQVAQCASPNITYCDEYGLTPNTTYTRFVVAYDNNGNGDISSASAQATTFALTPSAPTVAQGETPTTLSFEINVGGNSSGSSTEYVVRENVSGNYVNNLGELGTSEYSGTYSDFGGDNGLTVSGLFANARYVFEVKAVNSENISTSYSSQTAKYTRVAPLGTPVVEGVSDSSLRIKIANGGNPPFTQYQIKEKVSGKFVPKNGGALTNASVWGTYFEFGSGNGIVVTGLTPNTSYVFEISARNGDNIVGSTVESSATYTLASRPDSLLTTTLSARELNITLPTKYAGTTERFAIFNSELNKFVNQLGQLVDEPVWLTYSQFGGANGITVAGLVPGKGYSFLVKTRNISNVETQYSNASTAYTQPLVPEKPNASVISTTGARIFLINPGNDSTVLYAIQEIESSKFVSKDNGNLIDTPSWGTYDEFGGTGGFLVKGLPSASDTQFRVRARNLGQVASSYSDSVLVQTNALIYNVPAQVKVTLAGDENVDVSQLEGSQRGVKTLSVVKSDVLVAEMDVKFDSDKDWGNVVVDTDLQNSKSVIKLNPESGLNGTFTLYTPANNTQRLRVCPGSEKLSEVTLDCNGGVIFEGQLPQTKEVEGSDVVVTKEEIDGTLYWVASGLKGTGAIGETVSDGGKEPTVIPEEPTESNNPLVIDIPVEQIVQNINNETVKNVAKVVLTEAPKRTVLAMRQVSDVVETTALANLDQPQLEVVSTVATATTVTVGLAVLAGGFVNIPYLVAQFVISLLSLLGFVKKSRPYGLVYDSVTKKPIDRAVVRVYNMTDKLVWTDVTSAFGTFGANLPIGRYKILVVKPGYKFPSTVVSSPIDYPLEPVYHGEIIKFNRRNEFNIVIPMDQIEKTGFAKTLAKLFSSASILVKVGHILLFLAGFLLAVHTMYQYPSTYNLIALLFYIPALFLLLRNILIKERSKGMVIDRNGNPIEGVTVTLKEMKFDKYVAKRVTDKNGEYQMIVPNGTYQLGIMDDEYRAVRYEGGSSIISRRRKGKELVIDRAIIVRKK